MVNHLGSELLGNVSIVGRNRDDAIEVGITAFLTLTHHSRTVRKRIS
jgi:hypothetical protein